MNNTIYGGVTTTPVPLMFADQTYNPESENAQSGKAVEEAIQSNIDQTGDPTSPRAQSGFAVAMAVDALIKIRTDQTYSPTSENAQSGIAVAEALATVGGNDFVLIGDATLAEPAAVFKFSSDLNGNSLSQYKDFFLYFYGSTALGTSNRAFAVRANAGAYYFMWRQIGSVAADRLFGFWHSIEEIYNADDLTIWKSNFSATALLNVLENGASQGLSDNNVSVSSDFSVSLKNEKITSIDFFLPGTSGNTYTAGSRCMLFGRAR